MIIYNKKETANHTIDRRIEMFQKTAEKWEKQIKNYQDRQMNGTIDEAMATKQINFCIKKLDDVNAQIKLLKEA